ncbi:hypothetical protein AB0D04_09910 [Streptomyces sp. NPDC048483]|uniref:hypothetical protein n=1 Tax=Streptomyces sp. NPDC048483 TaxID=3154927 RepID=UPI0034404741
MSAHQPSPTPEGRAGAAIAAARRAADDAPEQLPTMNQLLAACAAASAVSTPPDATAETRASEPDKEAAPASTEGRDAA